MGVKDKRFGQKAVRELRLAILVFIYAFGVDKYKYNNKKRHLKPSLGFDRFSS
jgi:hypothetical protein